MADQRQEPPETHPPEAEFIGLPKKVTALLEKESDRGAILILGAYLDEILALVVRSASTSDQLGKDLLEFRGPAGDFSSKIALCEAFGLISPDEASALNALRRIRNSAAHFDSRGRGFDVLFDSAQTIQQVRGFVSHLNLQLPSDKQEYVREAFIVASRLLATKLFFRLVETQRAPVAKSVKEVANVWRERMKETPIGKAMAEAEKQANDGNPEPLFDLFQSIKGRLEEKAMGRQKKESQPPNEGA